MRDVFRTVFQQLFVVPSFQVSLTETSTHTAFTLQIHHTRLSPRKHSPDGAIMTSGSNRLITAYYPFIDPESMKG